ncbi:MAG: hypothetical protein M0R48_04830 [Candidatus Omnitrophica bacterium]|nr:hypothetical protein [Candidatus Omnitrophota bacterium]
MGKRFSYLFILSIFLISGIANAQAEQKTSDVKITESTSQPVEGTPKVAEQPKEEVVKGIIKEIAADGSFVVIENTKVLTTKEFLDDSYLEVGDNVEVIAQVTEAGLKAKNYNYIFEEEGPSATSEEPPPEEQEY